MTKNLRDAPNKAIPKPTDHLAAESGARLVLRYQPRRRQLTAVTDDLAGVLEQLPVGVQMRNIVSIERNTITFWMCFDNLGANAQEPLVKRFEAVGLDIRAGEEAEAERLYGQFPHGEVDGRLMIDSQGRELIALKVVDGWSVTRPGMTRSIIRWLLRTGHISHLILTAAPDRTPGFMHFDLVFALAVEPGDLRAAAELAHLLEQDLDVDIRRHRGKSALRYLNSLNPQSVLSCRPQHPGCIGNVADLFST